SPVASCSATARFPKVDRCDIFAKPMDSTPYRVRVLLHVDSGRFRFSPTTDCAFHAIIALASSASALLLVETPAVWPHTLHRYSHDRLRIPCDHRSRLICERFAASRNARSLAAHLASLGGLP